MIMIPASSLTSDEAFERSISFRRSRGISFGWSSLRALGMATLFEFT